MGRGWEEETEQWCLRAGRGTAEGRRQERGGREGRSEGGEAVEWQQLTQEGRGQGKKALRGLREEAADPRIRRLSAEGVRKGQQLQVETQQWALSNSSQDQVQDLAVCLGIYKDLGSWSPLLCFL